MYSTDPFETEALGAEIGAALGAGDVVLVEGDLGAGKTTLIRGVCRALGVVGPVTSPSFTIGNLYEGHALLVAHLDLYRVERLDEEDPGLLADYLGPDRITLVEWPRVAGAAWASPRLRVDIAHAGADRRQIEVVELNP